MRNAIFVVPPAVGHLNPIIGIARLLENSGINVYVVSRKIFKNVVESRGLKFIENNYIESISITDIGIGSIGKLKLFLKNAANFLSNNNKIQFELEVKEFQHTIKQIEPEYVFIDAQLPALFIVIGHLPIKLISIDTMLSTKKGRYIPPLNCFYIPNEDWISRFNVSCLWLVNRIKKNITYFRDYIIHLANDKRSLLNEWVKWQDKKLRLQYDFDRSFNVGIEGIRELVVYPKELDYPFQPVFSNRFHVGQFFNYPSTALQEPFYSLITNTPKNENSKFIYCSFGTLSQVHNFNSIDFFRKLILLMVEKKNWTLCLSCGSFFDALAEEVLPSNVNIFRTVPQLELLPFCDLFISHAGPNSIMESIVCETPLLVYPLNSRWDHEGDAARVVYHNLGLRGNLSDSSDKIDHDINTVLEDRLYKDAVKEMNKKIKATRSSDASLLKFLAFTG